MRTRPILAVAVAAVLVAAACGTGRSSADSVAVADSARAAVQVDSVALRKPGAPATAPSPAGSTSLPNGSVKAETTKPVTSKIPAAVHPPAASAQQEPAVRKELPLPDTNPRPSNRAPAGATTGALVVFRDSVMTSDLDWLRGQGFTIVNVHAEAHAVSVRVPQGYSGNPKANPRVLRFTIAMR